MTSSESLRATAAALVAGGKGLLAADERTETCCRRFAEFDIACTGESRRAYREMLFTTPGLSEYITGVIMFDETIRQSAADGRRLVDVLHSAGILPGIKVDNGAKPLAGAAGETVTEGLDGLRPRLEEYREMGARFAKWRAVIRIGDTIPTSRCIEANAHALARYATLAQEAGLVPIVEPEVLRTGQHDIGRCRSVTESVLRATFEQLVRYDCLLEGIVLKPNMVTHGSECPAPADSREIAGATIQTLRRTVPAAVPGLAFLSGGQSGEEATTRLNAMNERDTLPWRVTFSFGRALQHPSLQLWGGEPANNALAQAALLHRARLSSLGQLGKYTRALEGDRA